MSFATNEWSFISTAHALDERQSFSFEFEPLPDVRARISFADDSLLRVKLITALDMDAFNEAAAVDTAIRIIDRLAFEHDIPFGEVRLVSWRLKDGRCSVSSPTRTRTVVSVPSETALRRLEHAAWGAEPDIVALACNLYREALATEDVIATYVLLWQALVMLCGNSETQADEAVQASTSDVAMPYSRKRKREVSLVLDTRDEIGHLAERRGRSPDGSLASGLRCKIAEALPYLNSTVREVLAGAIRAT